MASTFGSSIFGTTLEANDFVTNILESSTEYSIFGSDLDGTIVLWNEGARRIYGYEPSELIGTANSEILHTPEDVAMGRPRQMLEVALRIGKWDGTIERVRKKGEHFTARVIVTPRRDTHGEVVGFLVMSKDISGDAEAEERIRALNAELETQVIALAAEQVLHRNRELAAINAAIASMSRALDLEHVLQDIIDAVRELVQSRYAALGIADENGRIKQFVTSGVSSDVRAAIGPLPQGHGLLGELIKEGTALRIPYIAQHPHSCGFPANHPPMKSFLAVPMLFQGRAVGDLYLTDKIGQSEFSEDDQTLLMLLAGHAAVAIEHARLYEEVRLASDQLEARNAELQQQNLRVQEANRLKSEFLANMSHELRTPLNAIIGFTEIIHDEKVGPVASEQKEYLGDILTSGRHLLQIINDILDLSKVESGNIDFRPETVELARVVREVRDILRPFAAKKLIYVKVDISPSLSYVVTDPSRLKQILYNYLSNAIKFTPDEGSVSVRVVPEGNDHFRIEVEDSGIGIAPEDMDRLFVEFQQLDTSTAKKYQGTGLGLTLTRRIVEAQGGSIAVESELGKGSTFVAVLPRVLSSSTVDDAQEEWTAPPDFKPGAPMVLVVEDDLKSQAWLARMLSNAGYNVEVASTGGEALAACRGQAFDAITLDLLLPDMGGWEALRRLRQEGPNHVTPVIVVTVVGEIGSIQDRAIHGFLVKPISAGELLSALALTGVQPEPSSTVLLVYEDEPELVRMCDVVSELGYRSVCASDLDDGLRVTQTERPAAVLIETAKFSETFEFVQRFREMAGGEIPVIACAAGKFSVKDCKALQTVVQAVVQAGERGAQELVSALMQHLPPRNGGLRPMNAPGRSLTIAAPNGSRE